MKSVFVDFNDLGFGTGFLHACYPEHVADQATLEVGERVELTDNEGDSMAGVVDGFENHGRGDLVRVRYIPGTWQTEEP